ncbi:MAG: hypothetical protein JST92_05230 [Deltaproteobacteria bacterium]|nr:hypothetical protein [Deltaproteobacteria bacterium]
MTTIARLRFAAAIALLCAACHSYTSPEDQVRQRLGVPDDATRVLVFAQTSHLDLDWQRTFDDYYASFVGDIFLSARKQLEAQPRASYSVAEMAFVQEHLKQHPEEEAAWKAQIARGALRIVGGGMTSPDTLLPETELLLRDYTYGARFAEDRLGASLTSGWLPDSFGHNGMLPDLLSMMGFRSVAFSRVDGAPTFYEHQKDPSRPPLSGSLAELLTQRGAADFLWEGPGGGLVLAHWMAGGALYCTGDDVDYDEPLQIPGGHLGPYRGDDPTFTDGKIQGYLDTLGPLSPTPYVFVPVGCDFQFPKDKLIAYLDGWNARHAGSHVFAAAGTFEDYTTLVLAHTDELATIGADITPYYTGFYGSRPEVKQRVRQASEPFFAAETIASALGTTGADLMSQARDAQELLARTDHHDFVTGTSNDKVVTAEQLPLLDQVEASGRAVEAQLVTELAKHLPANAAALTRLVVLNPSGAAQGGAVDAEVVLPAGTGTALHAAVSGAPVALEVLAAQTQTDGTERLRVRVDVSTMNALGWRAVDLLAGAASTTPAVTAQLLDASGQPATGSAVSQVILSGVRLRAQLDRGAQGFALTSLKFDGAEQLSGPSVILGDYADQGGLWRLGMEMQGCSLSPLPAPAQPDVAELLDASALSVRVAFHAASSTFEASISSNSAALDLAMTTGAPQAGATRTTTFALAPSSTLRTSQAGGYLDRVEQYLYTPTYWPAVSWASIGGAALLLRQSSGVRLSTSGALEILTARDARAEVCDAEGGSGSDPLPHRTEWRLVAAASPSEAERAAQRFNRPLEAWQVAASGDGTQPLEQSLVQVEDNAALLALKPADRGDGLILRVEAMPGPVVLHFAKVLQGKLFIADDALERDQLLLGAVQDPIEIDRDQSGSAVFTFRIR